MPGERAVGYAVDGAWEEGGGEDCFVLRREVGSGLPVWPVSFVTRRLGKVITCLGGGGGGKMDLGGRCLGLAPVLQEGDYYEASYCKIGFEIMALN